MDIVRVYSDIFGRSSEFAIDVSERELLCLQVLRHFKDGRAVDVHGWNMSDGNNMGCENSVHGDCRGVSYVFTVLDTSRL